MASFQSIDTLVQVPAADLATSGTLTFAYPAGKTSADYVTGSGAVMFSQATGPLTQGAGKFSLAYGGTIVLTYLGATTLKAGTAVRLQIPRGTYGDLPTVDVGASFNQTTLNAAFKAVNDKVNALQALLRATGNEPV